MTVAHSLVVVDDIALETRRIRSFLGQADDEPVELTFFVEGRIFVAHAITIRDHVSLLRQGEKMRGFNGAYQLVNGPIDEQVFARYEPNKIHRAWNGRVNDTMIETIRAVFLDCDPVRIKGISATDAQKNDASSVADRICELLRAEYGADAIGRGDSGNGCFVLIAVQPTAPTAETTQAIGRFLDLLQKEFGTKTVKIDGAVANPARLMPAPGTWKRKGWHTLERPHRKTSFECASETKRIPLEAIVGKLGG